MQIVIDVPEEVYERFGYDYSEENSISKCTNDIILDAFCTGIPLPKGHGRLIDANAYDNSLKLAIPNPINNEELNGFMKGLCKAKLELIDAPTIIEADKAEGSEA